MLPYSGKNTYVYVHQISSYFMCLVNKGQIYLQSSQPVICMTYILVYILNMTNKIITATIPAHDISVRFALVAGSTKSGVIPGGGFSAGILVRSTFEG